MEHLNSIGKSALSISELASTLGIGRNKAHELVRAPGFPAIRVGRRILIPVEGLRAWLVEQVEAGGSDASKV
ncbi:MAG: helix-turn-helix domain-containing protein [Christensenellales bacterium]